MIGRRFTGVFLNPYYVQDEGVGPVFDRLEKMGATAVVTHPRVAIPVDENQGVRFPDLHGDGYRRVLARPLWGRSAVNVRATLAYEPNIHLYGKSPYPPPVASKLEGVDRSVPGRIIAEAHSRGMEAHLLMHPFRPQKARQEDLPVYVDGRRASQKNFSGNVCLNSPAAFEYALAFIVDLVNLFPEIDGIMPDWVEYGAYDLEDIFSCFCPYCQAEAIQNGFDWDEIYTVVRDSWDYLHGLSDKKIASLGSLNGNVLRDFVEAQKGLQEFIRFKAHSVRKFYDTIRTILNTRGRKDISLTARGWPPPWNKASGMSYGELTDSCNVAAPKLFTFDYSALPRWYGERLVEWNPQLSEQAVLDLLVAAMDLPDTIENRRFDHYHIPAPGEAHPASVSCYAQRIREVAERVRPRALLRPFTHAYLPEPQWAELLEMMNEMPIDGIWIQMYGYLSDRKMDMVREMWSKV